MSFAAPLVLLGLVALPLLAGWYVTEQRRRGRAARAFVAEPMIRSVAPRRPGWRRHAPYVLLALALALLIVAAARPQRLVTVPVTGATVMLANDVSNSMTSTDVKPSRLVAAKRAATSFVDRVPASVQVGSIEFARHPILLQSPTTDHELTREAIAQVMPGGGGTAIGEAIETALTAIETAPKIAGKRPPGAVVLISDGASNVGISPIDAAEQARREHVRIYTISIGTATGTMRRELHGKTVTTPVPVDPTELARIAATSGGRAYRGLDSAEVNAIYSRLAAQLGHKRVERQLIAGVAGGGLVLLAIACVLSMLWFARLA